MVHVSFLPVLVAAVVVFVLGWLWYSPVLFYKPWMRLRGLDPVAAMAGAKMPGGKLLVELVRCLLLAYVIARFVALLGISSWLMAVHFGFMAWIGFPVIILTGSVLWENTPWKVAAIHAGLARKAAGDIGHRHAVALTSAQPQQGIDDQLILNRVVQRV